MKASKWTARFLITEALIFIGFFGVLLSLVGSDFDWPPLLRLILGLCATAVLVFGYVRHSKVRGIKDVTPDFRPEDDTGQPSALADAGWILTEPVSILHFPTLLRRGSRKSVLWGAMVSACVVATVIWVLCLMSDRVDWHDPRFVLLVVGMCSAVPLMCYLIVIGLFVPKDALDNDPALRAFLARVGLRSLLGLRVVALFLLLALVLFARWFLRSFG